MTFLHLVNCAVNIQITLQFFSESKFGYCYHSVNVISFLLDQSDHIKRLPLYNDLKNLKNLIALTISESSFFILIFIFDEWLNDTSSKMVLNQFIENIHFIDHNIPNTITLLCRNVRD